MGGASDDAADRAPAGGERKISGGDATSRRAHAPEQARGAMWYRTRIS